MVGVKQKLSIPDQHQLKILLSNFKYVPFMRSHSLTETRRILKTKFGYSDTQIKALDKKYDTEKENSLLSKKAFVLVDNKNNVLRQGMSRKRLEAIRDKHNRKFKNSDAQTQHKNWVFILSRKDYDWFVKKNPYASDTQRRKFHAMAERGEISSATVKEFDKASKGMRLPERKNIGNQTYYVLSVADRPHVQKTFETKQVAIDAVSELQTEYPNEDISLTRMTYSKKYGFGKFFIKRFKPSKTKNAPATASGFRQHQKSKLHDLAQTFQGQANGQKTRVVESDYTPKDKYRLGHLVQLKIKDAGRVIPIDFDGEAYLAGDLKNNLWIVGKDSRIENIKLPPKGQMKYLGELVQIDYVTAKKHIEGGKTIRFYHKLGEVTQEKPNLFIDDEGFPVIVGGNYDIWDIGIVN